MKYPSFIKKGGTIGIFAPSFGANIDPYQTRLNEAITRFKSLGYQIVIEGSIFGYQNGASDSKEKRAEAFMNLYQNDQVDFIWSVGGGEVMMEILDFIDFDVIKSLKPKFFMGYSDNTNLTFLLTTLSDVASIYGQNVTEFGMRVLDPSLVNALTFIEGKKTTQTSFLFHEPKNVETTDPLASYQLTEPNKWKNLRNEDSIHLEGRFIGGCLDVLLLYPGTKYDRISSFLDTYKDDGIVWYLEACDLNVFAYKRALWQLKNAGWFKHVKGFIFGRPLMLEPFVDMDQYTVTSDILGDLNVPIIMDSDIGYVQPTLTLLNGAYAKIHSSQGKGEITFEQK